MKKNLFVIVFLFAVAVLASCSSSKKTASTSKKATGSTVSLSDADLQDGKHIWETNCERCHKLYAPESHSRQQWEMILPRMVKRSKLNDADGEKVKGYIMSLAKS